MIVSHTIGRKQTTPRYPGYTTEMTPIRRPTIITIRLTLDNFTRTTATFKTCLPINKRPNQFLPYVGLHTSACITSVLHAHFWLGNRFSPKILELLFLSCLHLFLSVCLERLFLSVCSWAWASVLHVQFWLGNRFFLFLWITEKK